MLKYFNIIRKDHLVSYFQNIIFSIYLNNSSVQNQQIHAEQEGKFTLMGFIISTESHKSFTGSNKLRECIKANNTKDKLKGKFKKQTWFIDIWEWLIFRLSGPDPQAHKPAGSQGLQAPWERYLSASQFWTLASPQGLPASWDVVCLRAGLQCFAVPISPCFLSACVRITIPPLTPRETPPTPRQ